MPGWLTVVLVVAEIVLAAWLASGWKPRLLRLAAVVAFGGFATYSIVMLVKGQADCGCFGALRVNPGLTSAVDLLAVAMLLLSGTRPLRAEEQACREHIRWPAWRGSFGIGILLLGAVAALSASFGSKWWRQGEPPRLPMDGEIVM